MKTPRIPAVVLALCLLVSGLSGCHKEEAEPDGPAVLEHLLEQVTFASELQDMGEDGALFFTGLPEGSRVALYMGNGSFADEAALITLPAPSDSGTGMAAVEQHLEELRSQYRNYIPEEAAKIDQALVCPMGRYIILCITEDRETAKAVLDGTGESGQTVQQPEQSTQPEQPDQSPQPEQETLSPVPDRQDWPRLESESGTWYQYPEFLIRVDRRAYAKYGFSETKARTYAELVSRVADRLAGEVRVYSMPVPTAIGVVLPDDIAQQMPETTTQGDDTRTLFSMMSENVIPVNCYESMMPHRDEALYFATDYHWNGPGAYYGYEAFCRARGVEPYGLDQREELRFPDFLGILYWNDSGKDPVLKENPDTILAYRPVSPGVTMNYTDKNGNSHDWDVIHDVSDYKSGSKYLTFAAGDNPIARFHNPQVKDGSVCILVKDSYGNALLSYLVDHYSTVYELDPRYWTGNLIDFAREKQADDLIIENNLTGVCSNYALGKLSGIIP